MRSMGPAWFLWIESCPKVRETWIPYLQEQQNWGLDCWCIKINLQWFAQS